MFKWDNNFIYAEGKEIGQVCTTSCSNCGENNLCLWLSVDVEGISVYVDLCPKCLRELANKVEKYERPNR